VHDHVCVYNTSESSFDIGTYIYHAKAQNSLVCSLVISMYYDSQHFVAAFLEVHILFSTFLHQSPRCLDIIHVSLFSLLK
jgi:hypothetical protein